MRWVGDGDDWAGLGWARLVCGFVGSWVALGFVWVSFPRATSEGFSLCTLTAGAEMSNPKRHRGIDSPYYGLCGSNALGATPIVFFPKLAVVAVNLPEFSTFSRERRAKGSRCVR